MEPMARDEMAGCAAKMLNDLAYIAGRESRRSYGDMECGFCMALAMVYGEAPQQIQLEIEGHEDEA